MKNNVQKLTRAAVLLALALVFQNLRIIPVIGVGPQSQYIIGSLVNATLIVAAGLINIYAAITIGIIAPIVAYVQGQVPAIFPYLIPIIAIGNALIVSGYYLLRRKYEWIGMILGASVKTIFLYYSVQFMLSAVKGNLAPKVFEKVGQVLSLSFSWPQLITGLIGGVIGIMVLKSVKKAIK